MHKWNEWANKDMWRPQIKTFESQSEKQNHQETIKRERFENKGVKSFNSRIERKSRKRKGL